jgi:tRNA (guanine-N7-)-methyltransferase
VSQLIDPQSLTPHRSIRSYVRRQGRQSAGKQKSFDEQFARYGLDATQPLVVSQVFAATQPLVLEIGIGNGEALAHLAQAHPLLNFVGVDVHTPGIGYALRLLQAADLTNVRLFHADVMTVLEQALADHSLARVLIWMPDPWPKKRHHKRRLIQLEFLTLLHQKLQAQGTVHFASDWAPYVEWVRALFNLHQDFQANSQAVDAAGPAFIRPATRFGERGQRLGHELADLIYQVL